MNKRTEQNLRKRFTELQHSIGEGNRERGFHDEGDALREIHPDGVWSGEDPYLRNYFITKLALIGTEVTEAIEELRNGRLPDERYFSGVNHEKPEGLPSELADIMIRTFDLADEIGIDLIDEVLDKLAYNAATRTAMHGGKKV